ncbi:MAG TPA: hypothetical protein VEW42_05060, partial [Candidatus Eisenbacteria bacterium]|nr:hypothetical protein [Candidatus Eisenbacteria bacterium]
MNYAELTSGSLGRYDGSMDPNVPEQQPATEGEFLSDAEVRKSKGEKWRKNLAAGQTETDVEPIDAQTTPEGDMAPKAQSEAKKFTRDKLMEISKTIQSRSSPSEVLSEASFVAAAAKILEHNVRADVTNHGVNKDILKEMDKPDGGIFKQLQDIVKFLENHPPDGQTTDAEDTPSRQATILGEAQAVAKLSEQIAAFYKKAEISKEYDDPFKQIVSFEELMTKFNITLDDDRFRPGGEFSILDINAYIDNFGREMSTETAHPENFLRWVEERAWFYHDFDPMKDINLFENMYIVAGARKVALYEMLVDFNAYFGHRKPTKGELQVKAEDINRADEQGKYKDIPDEFFEIDSQTKQRKKKKAPEGHENDPEYDNNVIGYYTSFVNPETGKQTKAYVKTTGARTERRGEDLYDVFYVSEVEDKDGNKVMIRKPVYEWLANKEEWEVENKTTSTSKEFARAQEEIMYQLWLMTMNHNYDVSYRQKGMPNEKPLSEVMAEIYSDNKFTRTRRRLWAVLDMPATTHRDEIIEQVMTPNNEPALDAEGKPIYRAIVAPSESQKKFKDENGKLGHQGSLGKAVQRSLAGYYHVSEANAAFGGYKIEGGINPFFEVLKNKEGVNGAEIMYSSVIRRLLLEDQKFGYIYEGYDPKDPMAAPSKSRVEVEFFNALNDTLIPRTQKEMLGTSRKRHDWEKADFVDFMTLSKQEFLVKMSGRHITAQSLEKAFNELKKRYANNQTRLDEVSQLESRLTNSSDTRREAFLDSLVGHAGIKADEKLKSDKSAKDRFMSEFLKPSAKDPMKGLDLLAVGLFTKAFGTEFTPDMNPYSHIRYSLEARELMRGGMRDALSFTEKLDEFEAKWAEEWAYTFTFHTGISARNDMPGIGHDAWSKVLNTEWYRLRQTGGGNYPGNLENLYGIHRLGVNFWEGLVVREDGSSNYDKNLYEELVGLQSIRDKDGNITGYKFDINRDMPGFEFAGNAQRQFYADHVNHAIELFIDITQKHE